MQTILSFTLGVALAGAAAGAAAQSTQPISMALSNPSRPATLEVKTMTGDIEIKAYDGNTVLVSTDDSDSPSVRNDRDDDDDRREREGLRRLPNTSLGVTVEENDNVVTISMDMSHQHSDLTISVPRRTSVHAKTFGGGGDIKVTGVTGEHELQNVNGDITAIDVAGTIVAGTNNGDVNVSLTELTPGKALSFSSFNGDIEVTLPSNAKADLLVNSAQGEVWTDFDVTLQPQPSVVEQEGGNGGRNRVRMQREMRATIGGGGSELRFKTFHGDITIRKRK
jgi:DUF4097 and DUF4098 domain-containing protein YvlB